MSSPVKYRAPASLAPGQQGVCSLQRIRGLLALASRPRALPRWFHKSPCFFCWWDGRNWRAWYPQGSSPGGAELGLYLTLLPEESWHHHYVRNAARVEQGRFTPALTSVHAPVTVGRRERDCKEKTQIPVLLALKTSFFPPPQLFSHEKMLID